MRMFQAVTRMLATFPSECFCLSRISLNVSDELLAAV